MSTTREESMTEIHRCLDNGHPNPEGFLEWVEHLTDAQVEDIANACREGA